MRGAVAWDPGEPFSDWNGNGEFESGDLVVAFVEGGYEKGLRTDALVVPEPSSVILAAKGR